MQGIYILARQRTLRQAADHVGPTPAVLVGRPIEPHVASGQVLSRRIGEPVALNGAHLVPAPTGTFLKGRLVNVDKVILLVDLSVLTLRIGRASRNPVQSRRALVLRAQVVVAGERGLNDAARAHHALGHREANRIVGGPTIRIGRAFIAGPIQTDDNDGVVLIVVQIVDSDGRRSHVRQLQIIRADRRRSAMALVDVIEGQLVYVPFNKFV